MLRGKLETCPKTIYPSSHICFWYLKGDGIHAQALLMHYLLFCYTTYRYTLVLILDL